MNVKRNKFEEGSRRHPEMIWWDRDGDWRVVVADQGVHRRNCFNVLLGTDLYESQYGNGVMADTRVHSETVVGYEDAIARATELIMGKAQELSG